MSNLPPRLTHDEAQMPDDFRLPLRHWGDHDTSKAIVLALHGMNDYSKSFPTTGVYLARQEISLIAYDQRGFGKTRGSGYWHGRQKMVEDMVIMSSLIADMYPDKPLFLLGESMGGAVILASLQSHEPVSDGVILIAPAIWSRETMPWYQRSLLWIAAHTLPGKKLTGEGLDIQPSDNIEMLRELSRDPLVIKGTRVDALYGIANLMDQAAEQSGIFTEPALIMYGKHDQIVPRAPTCKWLQALPDIDNRQQSIVLYEDGYHMLNRDMNADRVLADISNWIIQTVESGTEKHISGNDHLASANTAFNLDKFCNH